MDHMLSYLKISWTRQIFFLLKIPSQILYHERTKDFLSSVGLIMKYRDFTVSVIL